MRLRLINAYLVEKGHVHKLDGARTWAKERGMHAHYPRNVSQVELGVPENRKTFNMKEK